MNPMTDALKIYELSRIWKEAAYNFAFWDKVNIDWDGEYKEALARVLNTKDLYDYYLELKRFAALLNDGHTDVSFPNEIYQDPEFFSMFPVYFAKPGDGIIVAGTSEDVKDDIPLFSILIKIDGTDIHDYVKENCYPYVWHANEAACGMFVLNQLVAVNAFKTGNINRILEPLKEMMKGEEYEGFLGTVEEGMSYGDVMILITQYRSALAKYCKSL